MIDVPLTAGGSDSQDLNRTLETLLVQYDYSLFEAMEILFPPIINEIKLYETPLQDLYTYIREAWGHFAQDKLASFPVLKMKLFSALIPWITPSMESRDRKLLYFLF